MTEAEWGSSTDPGRMLRPCRRIIREQPRKGRLFAVACCRRIWHLLADQRSRAAVEMAARYAEGLAREDELQAASAAAGAAHDDAYRARGKVGACAEWAAQFAASRDAWFAASHASNFAYVAAGDGLEAGPEHTAQVHLLRCIFGNPFRPVAVDPSWRSPQVLALAEAADQERSLPADTLDSARLAVLADALEDAGCVGADILIHLRDPGTHVRGCWVLDLLTGRE